MKTNLQSPPGESKTNTLMRAQFERQLTLLLLALMGLVGTVHATIYVNANNASLALNNTNDWLVGGLTPTTLPGPSDTIWFSGAGVTTALGGNLSVNGIVEDNTATGTHRIGATTGATLTIGAGGITKTNTGSLTMQLSCALALGANQTWTNAVGTIMLDRNSLTFNGYNVTVVGASTLDFRCATKVTGGTNMNVRCSTSDLNSTVGDIDFGTGSNSFTFFTQYGGIIEGSTFPTNVLATTSSAFGAGSCSISFGATAGAVNTLNYNGNTVATPEKITWQPYATNTINVTAAGQTLTLSNLVWGTGGSQTANYPLNFGGAGNLTLIKAISNAPSSSYSYYINKTGTGALTLTGTNLYSGNTIVNGGTFALTGSGSISNSPVISLGGGTMFDVSGLTTTPWVLQSSQTISNSSTTASATLNGSINASVGTLGGNFASGVVPFSIANGTLTISANTVFTLGAGGSGRLAVGTYPLITKGTGGTVSGTPPNTTTGSLAFPGGTGHLVNNNGELDFVVDTSTSAATEPLHWVGSGGVGTWDVADTANTVWEDSTIPTAHSTWYLNSDPVQLDEQYISADQSVTLNSTVTPPSLLVSNSTYNYSISGSGTIASSLTKVGNSNLVIGCAFNTTGALTNNGGTVQLTSGWPLTLGGLVGSGSTLDETINMLTLNLVSKTNTYAGNILAYFPAADGIIGSHAFGLQVTNSGKLVLNGSVSMAADASTLPASSVYFRLSAYNAAELDLGGTVNLTNVVLRNNNTGITRVTGGTVNSTSAYTYGGMILGDSSQFVVDNGAVSVPVVSVGFGGATTAGGCSFTVNNGSFTVVPGNSLGLEIGNNVSANTTSSVNLNGGILSTPAIVEGPGGDVALTQSGTNVINFNGGTLLCSASNVFPTDNGVNGTDPLQLRVGNGGAVINDGGYGQNLILPLQNYGAGGLTKLGSGTLTLTANNTYVGATLVMNGTLSLSGSATLASSLIAVSSGATFDVSGLSSSFALGVGQSLSNSAAATGTVNGNLDASVGKVSVSFAAGTPALTVANGALTLSAGTTVTVNNTGASLAAGTYPLITAGSGGSVVGTVPTVTVNGGGASGTASLQINSGELDLVVASSAPSPTNIVVTATGPNSLSLNWPAGKGWLLQSNSVSLVNTSAWQTVTGATPPFSINVSPNQANVFYRLKY